MAQTPSQLYNQNLRTSSSTSRLFSDDPRPVGLKEPYPIAVLIVAAVFIGLSLAFTILHLASGIVRRRRLVSVDCAVIIAFVLAIGIDVEALLAVAFGIGKPVHSFSPKAVWRLLHLLIAWRITYPVAKCAAQLAILLSLKESFTLKNRYFRLAWLTIAVGTVVSTATWLFIIFFPLSHFVRFPVSDRIVEAALSVVFGASSVMLLALPILPIWFAKVSAKRRSAMIGLWFIGFFNTWCIGAYVTTVLDVLDSQWFTYTWIDPLIITVAEVGGGLVIACMPATTALFTRPDKQGLDANSTYEEQDDEAEGQEGEEDSTKPLLATEH